MAQRKEENGHGLSTEDTLNHLTKPPKVINAEVSKQNEKLKSLKLNF